jgi:hypothetical protein
MSTNFDPRLLAHDEEGDFHYVYATDFSNVEKFGDTKSLDRLKLLKARIVANEGVYRMSFNVFNEEHDLLEEAIRLGFDCGSAMYKSDSNGRMYFRFSPDQMDSLIKFLDQVTGNEDPDVEELPDDDLYCQAQSWISSIFEAIGIEYPGHL